MALASEQTATFSDYDPLAWFYDRHWGPASADEVLPILDEILLPELPEGARVLDLGCGTGNVAAGLDERGFEVTGIDGSRGMLAYARNNAPGVTFEIDDLRRFEHEGPIDAAVATYETLNHLLDHQALASTFQRVAGALSEQGRFLFDLNMEAAYGPGWEGMDGVVEDDHVIVSRNRVDPTEQLASSELALFRHAHGAWRRSDLVLHHRWYDEEDVLEALAEAGFETAAIYDAAEDLGLDGQPGRRFFLATLG